MSWASPCDCKKQFGAVNPGTAATTAQQPCCPIVTQGAKSRCLCSSNMPGEAGKPGKPLTLCSQNNEANVYHNYSVCKGYSLSRWSAFHIRIILNRGNFLNGVTGCCHLMGQWEAARCAEAAFPSQAAGEQAGGRAAEGQSGNLWLFEQHCTHVLTLTSLCVYVYVSSTPWCLYNIYIRVYVIVYVSTVYITYKYKKDFIKPCIRTE